MAAKKGTGSSSRSNSSGKNTRKSTRKTSAKTSSRSNGTTKKREAYEKQRAIEIEEAKTPPENLREIYAIICTAVCLILILGTYGICGKVGTVISGFFFGLFGATFYFLPVVFLIAYCFLLVNGPKPIILKKLIWIFILIFAIGAICQFIVGVSGVGVKTLFLDGYSDHRGGGIVFGGLITLLSKVISRVGAIIITVLLIIIAFIEITNIKILDMFKALFDFNSLNVKKHLDPDDPDYDPEYDDFDEDEYDDYYERGGGRGSKVDEYEDTRRKIAGRKSSGRDILENIRVLEKTDKTKTTERKKSKVNKIVAEEEVHEILPQVDTSTKKTATSQNIIPISQSEIAMPGQPRKTVTRAGEDLLAEINYTNAFYNTGKSESTRKNKKEKDALDLEIDSRTYNDPLGLDDDPLDDDILNNLSDSTFSDDSNDIPEVNYGYNSSPDNIYADSSDNDKNADIDNDIYGEASGDTFENDNYVSPYNPDDFYSSVSDKVSNRISGEDPLDDVSGNTLTKASINRKTTTKAAKTSANNSASMNNSSSSVAKNYSPASAGVAAEEEEKVTAADKVEATAQIENEIEHQKEVKKKYVIPPMKLLESGGRSAFNRSADSSIKETAVLLRSALESFGVKVKITDCSVGPSITRYELQPDQGVRVNKILSLENDIKLALAATDIRIEAPIPGKASIGIEIPNKEKQMVRFRDLIDNDLFNRFKSNIGFAVGKDLSGQIIISDIAKMPHLLVAGATGSGKSVCINTLIMSILYKSGPDKVKMIMIDPKRVEFSMYNGIPHLLIPVVTDAKKAAGALNWAVDEMTKRYQLFEKYSVRNIEGFNKKVNDEGPNDDPQFRNMPQIVVIVDELADLMMVAHKEVEDSIVRICQLARAAGIHLIIATQRPSVDVITGLIKANVPSRIALSVSSQIDSRTIIDMAGGEKLLGNGDMLFYPTGYTKPVRLQGAYLSDEEIVSVVDFIKKSYGESSYDDSIASSIEQAGASSSGSGGDSGDSDESRYDELFEDAARCVIEKDKASIGYLQRMLRIGFNRAARIMDQLEEFGVVGPEEGTKPRKILMNMTQFEEALQ